MHTTNGLITLDGKIENTDIIRKGVTDLINEDLSLDCSSNFADNVYVLR